jgi:hypothetical protein
MFMYINTEFGCKQTLVLGDMTLSFSGAGAVNALDDSYGRLQIMKLEKLQAIDEEARKKKMSFGGGGNKEDKKEKLNTVFVVHAALHYLHLYPARGFEGMNGLTLGHYYDNVVNTLNQIREYLGPGSLVIWATTGNVCDEHYEGEYAKTLAKLKEGFREAER